MIADAAASDSGAEQQAAEIINETGDQQAPEAVLDTSSDTGQAVNVLVVSSDVVLADELAAMAASDVIVVKYDADSATLSDIHEAIKESLNGSLADNIGIATPGEEGAFDLTRTTKVTAESLESSSELQAFWKEMGGLLKSNGNIDLFGSGIAASDSSLLESLETLSDAALAASTDATGSGTNQDWHLETGDRDASGYFSDTDLAQWSGSLNSFNVSGFSEPEAAHIEAAANELNILVVSSSIDQAQILADAAADGVVTILYDAENTSLSELEQLIAEAANGQQIDNLAFATHGQIGQFRLTGDIWISAETIAEDTNIQSFWSNVSTHLADGANLDLLGCFIAGIDGNDFGVLAALDNALEAGGKQIDIAASTNDTGNVEGGDWILESGNVDASFYFESTALSNYAAKLATFNVTSTGASGAGTLHSAIQQANASAGADTITFSGISASSIINQTTFLPDITEQLTIDGTTAGNYIFGSNMVTIDFNNLNTGFKFTADNSIIRGLFLRDSNDAAIANYSSSFIAVGITLFVEDNVLANNATGVDIFDANGGTIQDNIFGLNLSGNVEGNSNGINIGVSSGLVIQDNLFVGSSVAGIQFGSILNGATAISIEGNTFGRGSSSNPVSWGNESGIRFSQASTSSSPIAIIGGNNAGDANIFGGNEYGIEMIGGSSISIIGNYIGTNASNHQIGNTIGMFLRGRDASSGTDVSDNIIRYNTPGANDGAIQLWGANYDVSGNTISNNTGSGIEFIFGTGGDGGDWVASDNTISNNTGYGIYLPNSNQIQITENSIFANSNDGIALNSNGFIQAPANVTGTLSQGNSLVTISGTFTNFASSPNNDFTVEYYITEDAGYESQGRYFLGSQLYTDAAQFTATAFSDTFDISFLSTGNYYVTATISQDTDGTSIRTSEFNETSSNNSDVPITANSPPVVDLNGGSAGTNVTRTFVEEGGPIFIAPSATITDANDPNLLGMTVTLTSRPDGNSNELLAFTSFGGITGNYTQSTGILALSGTASLADYQSVLRSITYNNLDTTDPNTSNRSITVRVTDGGDNSNQPTATIQIDAVNDPPTADIASNSYSVNENSNFDLTDKMTVTDPDSGNSDVTVTLSVGQGIISASSGSTGVSISGNNSSSITLTGRISELTNLLNGNNGSSLVYIAVDQPSSSTTLTLRIDDNGNTGGGNLFDTDTATLNITAQNDAPTADIALAGYTVFSGSNDFTGQFTIDDPDAANGNLTLTISVGEGTINASAGSTGVGITNNGSASVTVNGTLAELQNFLAGNGGATQSYTPAGSPSPSTTLTLLIEDNGNTGGGNLSDQDTATLTIDTNSPPSITAGGVLNYDENDPATAIDPSLSLVDTTDTDLEGATIQITGNYVNGEDILEFVDTSNITGSWNSGTGTLTLTGTDTVANYQAALQSVTYRNTSENPSELSRTVTYIADDGAISSDPATATVNVEAFNDPPVNTIPGAQATNEDTPLVFSSGNGNLISVADIDVDGNNLEVTLTATNGTITLNGTTGLNFSTGDGTADTTMTFTGSAASINNALDGLSFDPAQDYNGSANLQIVTDDQGFTGTGGSQTDTDNIAITVNSIDDPASLTNNGSTANEGGTDLITQAELETTDIETPDPADIIYTVTGGPANGQLELTGNPGVAITSFTQAQINSNQVVYVHDNSETASDSFTFNVATNSDGFTSETFAITVLEGNDPPILQGGSILNYSEGDPPTVIDSTITLSDSDDTSMEGATVTISNNLVVGEDFLAFTAIGNITGFFNPLTGVLTLEGTDTIANYQTALRSVTYQNGNSSPAQSTRTITYSVNDGDNNSNPLDSTVNVNQINTAPAGADNTIALNEDTSYNFNPADFGFSDADSGDFMQAVRIDTLSLDPDASLQLSGSDVVNGQIITTANIGNLVFTPGSNENGSAYSSFTFSVQDNKGDFAASSNTLTLDVTPVADAPTGATDTITINEDASYTFDRSDFGFSDVDGDAFDAVIIDSLPSNGTLTLNSVTLTGPTPITIDIADIDGDLLVFTPAQDENGNGYDSFNFRVQDDNASNNTDLSQRTLTFNVTPQGDAPTGANNTITVNEDTSHTFNPADFGFSDPDTTDFFQSVRIDILSLGAGATLQLEGVDVINGQEISTTDIANLVYTPGSDANGAAESSFTFSVRDSSGTYDPTPNTLTFDVDAVNDAPVNSVPGSQFVDEDTPLVFNSANGNLISVSDVDAGTNELQIHLTATNGLLTLSQTTGLSFVSGNGTNDAVMVFTGTLANINAALDGLIFDPTPDYFGNGANIQIVTSDQGSTGSGGSQSDTDNIAITVNAINDAPVVTAGATLDYDEGSPATVIDATVTITDTDDTNLEGATIRITTNYESGEDTLGFTNQNGISGSFNASNGTLTLTGTSSIANYQAALRSVTYQNSSNTPSELNRTVTFIVNDGDTNSSPVTSTITVTDTNDPPVANDDTINVDEGGTATTLVGGAATVLQNDTDSDLPGDTLTVSLESDVSYGSLTLNPDGTFSYTHDGSENLVDSFTYSVTDAALETSNTATVTININAINENTPVANGDTLTVTEGGSTALLDGGATSVLANDTDLDLPNDTLTVSLNTDVSYGSLTLNPDGTFSYTHDNSENFFDSFSYFITDGGGNISNIGNVSITVTPESDNPPTGADNLFTIFEDASHTFSPPDFGFSDADINDSFKAVRIDTINLAGGATLRLNGVDVVAGQTVAFSQITGLVLRSGVNQSGTSTFTFSVQDSADVFATTPNTMTVNILPVNDLPISADKDITINEDGSRTFLPSDFAFNDVEDGLNTFSSIRIDALNLAAGSTLELSNVAVSVNDTISYANISNLVFRPLTNDQGLDYSSFAFSVIDSEGGVSANSYTLNINVDNINDAPSAANNTLTLNEDGSHTFEPGDFGFNDIDVGDALSAVRIDSINLNGGRLTLSNVDVSVNDVIDFSDIVNLVYRPGANDNGNSHASFNFSVRDGSNAFSAQETITFNVTAVNDRPEASNNTITINEDSSHTFTSGNFNFSDIDILDAINGIQITSINLAAGATLEIFNGSSFVDVIADDIIELSDIVNMIFRPADDANGDNYSTIEFKVKDQSDAFSNDSYTLTFNITPQNDTPSASDNTITVGEDGSHTFTPGEFGFTDVEDVDSQPAAIRIDSLNLGSGTLTLSGDAVEANDVIAYSDIVNMIYTPGANENGLARASFTFSAQDSLGAYSSSQTITLDITAANDAPSGQNKTITINEDLNYTFMPSDFGYSDTDNMDDMTAIRIETVNMAPGAKLMLGTQEITGSTVILYADIVNLSFDPAENQTQSSSFTFSVRDESNAYDPTPKTITMNLTPVNDAPEGTSNTVTLNEDRSHTFIPTDFGFSDVDGDNFKAVRIDSINLSGGATLKFIGSNVTPGTVINFNMIIGLVFRPGANESGLSSFTFSVQDSNDAFSTSKTMQMNVQPVNDAPVTESNTISVDNDSTYTFTPLDFSYSDVEGHSFDFVRIDTLSLDSNASLTLSGEAVTQGQLISYGQLTSLLFDPSAFGVGSSDSSFTFSVQDSVGAFSGSETMTLDVTLSMNDEEWNFNDSGHALALAALAVTGFSNRIIRGKKEELLNDSSMLDVKNLYGTIMATPLPPGPYSRINKLAVQMISFENASFNTSFLAFYSLILGKPAYRTSYHEIKEAQAEKLHLSICNSRPVCHKKRPEMKLSDESVSLIDHLLRISDTDRHET